MNLITNQMNYGLINEWNFTINLCKNGQTHNKIKSVLAERFMKTLKAKIYKQITSFYWQKTC